MPGDANLTPSLPCLLPMLKTALRNPRGDVSYGRLWKLYTAFNTQAVPLISLPPLAARASTRLIYASGVCPNDTITHPDSARERCSEIPMTHTKCTLQIFRWQRKVLLDLLLPKKWQSFYSNRSKLAAATDSPTC